jgi:hypothetical protein
VKKLFGIQKRGQYEKDSRPGASGSRLGGKDSRLGANDSRLGASGSRLGGKDSRLGASGSRLGGKDSRLGASHSRLGGKDSRLGANDSRLGASGSRLGGKDSRPGGSHLRLDKRPRSCGAWDAAASATPPTTASYRVNFEKGDAVFNSSEKPSLAVYPRAGNAFLPAGQVPSIFRWHGLQRHNGAGLRQGCHGPNLLP